jgi:hypothetical protein
VAARTGFALNDKRSRMKNKTKFYALVSRFGLMQISLSPITSAVPEEAGDVLMVIEAPDESTAKKIVSKCDKRRRVNAESALHKMDGMIREMGADFLTAKTHDSWTDHYVEMMCRQQFGRSLIDFS